jgi:hypothetical protein
MSKRHLVAFGAAIALALPAAPAFAGLGPVTVQAAASIYDAGAVTPNYGYNALPTAITLLGGIGSVTFSGITGSITCTGTSAEGCITINNGTLNDADGAGAASPSSSNTGTASISGMSVSGAGSLVGLFVGSSGPSGAAPTALDFTATGLGTGFASLAPQLDQTFFVGDGLTGDGSGATQIFYVPMGATTLYLGLSDACNYNGAPSCYYDNSGSYSVTVGQRAASPTVPEPAGWAVLATALLALTATARRRHG